MKYLDEFSDPELAGKLLDQIRALATRRWAIMEVCGGQTHSIIRHGIDIDSGENRARWQTEICTNLLSHDRIVAGGNLDRDAEFGEALVDLSHVSPATMRDPSGGVSPQITSSCRPTHLVLSQVGARPLR